LIKTQNKNRCRKKSETETETEKDRRHRETETRTQTGVLGIDRSREENQSSTWRCMKTRAKLRLLPLLYGGIEPRKRSEPRRCVGEEKKGFSDGPATSGERHTQREGECAGLGSTGRGHRSSRLPEKKGVRGREEK
jgi:hypothetical protein